VKKTMKILQNENYTISFSNNTRIELKKTRNCIWKTTDLLNYKKSNLEMEEWMSVKNENFAKSWRLSFNINKGYENCRFEEIYGKNGKYKLLMFLTINIEIMIVCNSNKFIISFGSNISLWSNISFWSNVSFWSNGVEVLFINIHNHKHR
jgi:hypothetical protein